MSRHQRSPFAIFKNRFDQRVYSNAHSGAGSKGVFLSDGYEILDGAEAARIFLNHAKAPGPDHPTWYIKDRSGISMYDIYGYMPPWGRISAGDFFWHLIDGRYPDWSPRDFTLSRYNVITDRRDERPVYVVDNPNLLCIESRFTNVNRRAA